MAGTVCCDTSCGTLPFGRRTTYAQIPLIRITDRARMRVTCSICVPRLLFWATATGSSCPTSWMRPCTPMGYRGTATDDLGLFPGLGRDSGVRLFAGWTEEAFDAIPVDPCITDVVGSYTVVSRVQGEASENDHTTTEALRRITRQPLPLLRPVKVMVDGNEVYPRTRTGPNRRRISRAGDSMTCQDRIAQIRVRGSARAMFSPGPIGPQSQITRPCRGKA